MLSFYYITFSTHTHKKWHIFKGSYEKSYQTVMCYNRNIKIRDQLRILKCIAIVKEASRKVLKHVY